MRTLAESLWCAEEERDRRWPLCYQGVTTQPNNTKAPAMTTNYNAEIQEAIALFSRTLVSSTNGSLQTPLNADQEVQAILRAVGRGVMGELLRHQGQRVVERHIAAARPALCNVDSHGLFRFVTGEDLADREPTCTDRILEENAVVV